MTVTISDQYLNEIKKPLAYPHVDNILLSDDEIKTLCISPALREYFAKFPLRSYYSGDITGETTIDFPTDDVFGVLDTRVVDRGYNSGSGSNFFELAALNSSGNVFSKNMYGIKGYNPSQVLQQNIDAMSIAQTNIKTQATTKYIIDEDQRNITVYTSISGKLNITWAKSSEDFSNVRFARINDVVNLCQAYLLEHLSDTTSIMNDSSLDITVNSDTLKTRAEELYARVRDKWNAFPSIILLHN